MAENQTNHSRRGGKRAGAGRPKGRVNLASPEEIKDLESLAKPHAVIALQTLLKVATKGKSESARVAAANHLLDRGYGRPRQAIDHSGNISNLPAVVVE